MVGAIPEEGGQGPNDQGMDEAESGRDAPDRHAQGHSEAEAHS